MTRSTRSPCTTLALALACIACPACLPQPAPVEWDALDTEALREQIANPTGEVTDATIDEVTAIVVADLPAYRTITSFLLLGLIQPFSADAAPAWVFPQALNGTSVYALLACPGEDVNAQDVGFAYGWMRVDSPTLTQALIESRSLGGDLQLSFEACRIGEYTFNGPAPAHFDEDRPDLGVGMQISYTAQLAAREGVLDQSLLIDDDGAHVVFTLASGQTLTLEWSPLTLTLELLGTNGALVCEVIDDALECT